MLANTIKAVEDTILKSYLKNNQALSVPEIRDSLQGKLGATIIRKVATQSTRIFSTTKDVRIMSKHSPGCVHQWRSVSAFHPTREWLVEIINQTRREFAYHRYTTGRGFS